jgi:hypothetical protein
MAKKQIKELVIKTRSPGSKETRRELEAIQKAMEQTESSAKNINRQTGGSIKVLQKVSKEYGEISKSIQTATKAARSFNNALSGDTKTATKRISAYMDNIELLTLSMRDLSEESSKAVNNLDRVGTTTGGTSQEVRTLVNFIEQLYFEMVELNANTRESIETLDRLADRITDVETQTKKGRLQTEALGESFRETSTDAKKYGVSAGKAANDTRRLAGAGSQGARAFSDLAFRMNPIVSLYASIAVNVYAATEAFRLLNEASNLNRLNEQTARFAATLSGIDIKSLSEDLQELSGNALSAGGALRQSVRGVAYGFAADDLERLTAGARRASVALGVNFADAIDRAFRGIAKQEVEVLDEIGVVTRLETAFKKYAATLNKRADDLTEVERRAALTTEVISQLEKRFSSFSTQATGVEQLSVAMKDLVDNSLIQANNAIDELAKDMAALVRGFGGVESASIRVARAQEVYNEAVRAGEISQASVAYSQLQEALELVRQEQTEGTDQYRKYQKSVEEAKMAQGVMNKTLAAASIAASIYAVVLTKNLITSTVALAKKTAIATAATIKFIAEKVIARGVILSTRGAIIAYNTAMGLYITAMRFGTLATLGFAAAAAVASAPIWLVVGAVAAVVTGLTLLVNKLTDNAIFSAISNLFDWWLDKFKAFLSFIGVELEALGEKAKDFGKDAGKFIGGTLEKIADWTGINDITSQYLNLDEAQKEATMTAEEYRRSLTALGTDGAILNSLNGAFNLTRDQAEANLSYINSSKDLIQQIGTDLNNLEPPQTAFEKFSSTVKGLSDIPVTLKVDSNEWKMAENRFKDLQDQGVIPLDLKFDDASGWAEFNSRVQEVRSTLEWFANEAAFEVSKMSKSLAANDPAAGLKEARMEREQLVLLLDKYSKLGENVAKEERAEVLRNKQLLDLEVARLDNAVQYSAALRAQELSNKAQLGALERRSSIESEILEVQVSQLEAQIVTAKAKNQDVTQLQQELALLKQKLMFSKQDEALQQKEFMISQRMAALEQAQDRAGTERERVAIQKEINQAKQDEINLMVDGIEKQKAQANLDRQKAQTERSGNAAGFKDLAAVASSMGGMEGLSSLQSTALNSVSSISDVYGSFQENMKNSSESFFEFLKGDIQAFGQVAQAGLQFANGVFQQASQAKVDSLNREIEAEKRRDGKSAESKKKIKQLEAKRIKEEAKAKKASVVMSTAAAVMQAMAQIPWPANLAMAAATGVMGMMQISQIDKAAAGQVAGLNDAGGNLSLEGGKRTSEVDVAGSASAGELSYLRGESGTGSISNFSPGRASGNYASAGTSITVGESGPEEITPAMPVNVTPSGSSDGGEKIVFSPVINAQAVDSMGMEELLNRYSQQLYDGLETELRARNKSLDSL